MLQLVLMLREEILEKPGTPAETWEGAFKTDAMLSVHGALLPSTGIFSESAGKEHSQWAQDHFCNWDAVKSFTHMGAIPEPAN